MGITYIKKNTMRLTNEMITAVSKLENEFGGLTIEHHFEINNIKLQGNGFFDFLICKSLLLDFVWIIKYDGEVVKQSI